MPDGLEKSTQDKVAGRMPPITSFGLPLIFALLAGTDATAQDSKAPQVIKAGRAVALHVCAACHTVSAGPQMKPYRSPPAPNFSEIANRPDTSAERLLAFLRTRHQSVPDWREMPAVKTTDEQDRAVVAYIMGLRKPERPR
jgi:mono/diheme cytochrome c family protein